MGSAIFVPFVSLKITKEQTNTTFVRLSGYYLLFPCGATNFITLRLLCLQLFSLSTHNQYLDYLSLPPIGNWKKSA